MLPLALGCRLPRDGKGAAAGSALMLLGGHQGAVAGWALVLLGGHQGAAADPQWAPGPSAQRRKEKPMLSQRSTGFSFHH
jgi:hypothetical protein